LEGTYRRQNGESEKRAKLGGPGNQPEFESGGMTGNILKRKLSQMAATTGANKFGKQKIGKVVGVIDAWGNERELQKRKAESV